MPLPTVRPGDPCESDMEECSGETDICSLVIVHEPLCFDGPYGIFSCKCASCFCKETQVEVLLELPGKGYLLLALQGRFESFRITGSTFYDKNLTGLLITLGYELQDDSLRLKRAHYSAMQIACITNGHNRATPNSRKRRNDQVDSEATSDSEG